MALTYNTVFAPSDVTFKIAASVSLTVPPKNKFTANMISARYAQFSLESYYVSNGFPLVDTDKGCVVTVETGVTSYTIPAPANRTELVLNESSRWVPTEASYVDGATWAAISGNDRVPLKSDAGQTPVLNTAFTYLRGDLYTTMSSMTLSNGSSFYTDGLSITSGREFAFGMVLVPRATSDEMLLFQTGPSVTQLANSQTAGQGEYVSLTYDNLGRVSLYAGTDALLRVQTTTGGQYPSKPLIVGVHHSFDTKTMTLLVVDSRTQTFMNAYTHPYDAQLWVGGSYNGSYADGSLDALDACFWRSRIGVNNFLDYMQQLNQLYGVSAGRLTKGTAGDLA